MHKILDARIMRNFGKPVLLNSTDMLVKLSTVHFRIIL